LLQKLNPARLFGSDEKTASGAPLSASNSNPVKPENLGGNSQPESPAPPSTARYAYKSPAKPVAGQQPEAKRSFELGVEAQSAQRLTEAIRFYRQAIQIDPAYFDAYYNLGLAALASTDLPLALATYETALAIRPDSPDARYNFALALKQSNYPLDAANELLKLLNTYPNEGRAHLMLGNLYAQQLHQPAKARQHYLKVLETDPGNPEASAIHFWLKNNPL
jgi:tetratricopeptide (TPR) repeat protein